MDFVCPQQNDFRYDITIDGSQCSIEAPVHCLFSATPESFGGSSVVFFNILNFGSFVMTVSFPPTPPGLTLEPLDVSCFDEEGPPIDVFTQTGPATFNGTIQANMFAICDFEYSYSKL